MLEYEDNKPAKKDSWKIRMVKRFIEGNPDATIGEVVKACRTSASTVSRARKELLAAGLIPAAPTGRPPVTDTEPPNEGPTLEAQIAADIERAISAGGGKVLTRDERRQRLSAYADHPKVPHASKIAALKELEATEPKESELLGPGAPQTRPDAIERAALVLEAIHDIYGPEAAKEAITSGLRGADNFLEWAFIKGVGDILANDGKPT